MRRTRNIAAAVMLVVTIPAMAKEAVYLKTGFLLEADSHTQRDQIVTFRVGNGSLEFTADEVLRIEITPNTERGGEKILPSNLSNAPEAILDAAAQKQGVDEDFVRSVAKVESDLHQDAVSRKGAIGLMQLMPATAAQMGVNAAEMDDNARGGAKYLR